MEGEEGEAERKSQELVGRGKGEMRRGWRRIVETKEQTEGGEKT